MPTEAVTPEIVTGLSDIVLIVVTVCVTIIVVTWILRTPAFKISKCKDGVTLKVGDIAGKSKTSVTSSDTLSANDADSEEVYTTCKEGTV